MDDTGTSQTKDTAQPERRSQRPPRPLSHRMDLIKQYEAAGLRRKELGMHPRIQRRDKTNTTRVPTKALQNSKKERLHMETNTDTATARKPGTPGTQSSAATDNGVVSAMDCAKIGGVFIFSSITAGAVLLYIAKKMGGE